MVARNSSESYGTSANLPLYFLSNNSYTVAVSHCDDSIFDGMVIGGELLMARLLVPSCFQKVTDL